MRVQIKADISIPPGYTYERCDIFTAEQLLEECSRGCVGMKKRGRPRVNLNAVEYIAAHPKEFYTTEDVYRIGEMRPLRFGVEGEIREQKEPAKPREPRRSTRSMLKLPQDQRPGPVEPDDMTVDEVAVYFGASAPAMRKMIEKGGMPFRMGRNRRQCRFVRLPEVRAYLEGLTQRTKAQQYLLDKLQCAGV